MKNKQMDFGARVSKITQERNIEEQNRQIEQQKIAETIAAAPVAAPKQMGRPKKVSKLNRNMAKTIFFTEEIDQKLQMVKAIQKKEIKDVVFAATTMFLDKYYKDGRLSQEGLDFLEQTIY
ncbi:MAG: hypothetical protein MJZ69_07280 [Bacteroidaceae bacterium]|nr:hypothetical protein [Candidatus Minthousia equi]MCQ2246570.1 hypothetical protein [Bacteroidaceae bacterium]MDO4957078.1 hypothetical protein [Bacteroidales bacterium]